MNAERPFASWEQAVSWLRQQPDQTQLVADCYYDDPLIRSAQRYWQSEEWQAVRDVLAGRTGNALDVGAGRGIASYALARDGFRVTALEPDASGLVGAGAIRALAAESGLPIHVAQEYSECLPFADGSFDVVFARAVLHHTRDLEAACREFFRVLRPGGLLVAIREHVISAPADLPRFLEQHPLHRLYGGEHAYLLSEYIAALERAGFAEPVVLSPWRSPINFAPYSLDSLQDELARRAARGVRAITRVLRAVLALPGVWPLARSAIERVDRRPGRLYSFLAVKH